jgi:hypothetical protein
MSCHDMRWMKLGQNDPCMNEGKATIKMLRACWSDVRCVINESSPSCGLEKPSGILQVGNSFTI